MSIVEMSLKKKFVNSVFLDDNVAEWAIIRVFPKLCNLIWLIELI